MEFYILFSFFLFKTSIMFMKHKIQSKNPFNRKKGENNIMKYEIKRSETKTTDSLENKRVIIRGSEQIELTDDEIRNAHEYFVISWMECVIETDFEIKNKFQITKIAESAYDLYSEGNGLTEYEAIERAVENSKGAIQMGLEEILKEFGTDIPFDEKGDLTPNGADAWEKLIRVVTGLNDIGAIQEKADNVENYCDEIVRLGF